MRLIPAFIALLLTATTLTAQDKTQSVEGGFSAISSHRKLRSNGDANAQRIIDLRDESERPMATWGIFVNYRRQLAKRFIMNVGLAYERHGYISDFDARYSSQIGTGGTTGPVPNGYPYKIQYTDIYHIARVPITLDYYFSIGKRFSWYVNAGFSLDFMADNYTLREMYYTSGEVKKSKFPNAFFNSNAVTASHTGGIGGEYKFGDKAGIRVNILYSQNLFAFNSDPDRLHLQWAALNVGYNYRIK